MAHIDIEFPGIDFHITDALLMTDAISDDELARVDIGRTLEIIEQTVNVTLHYIDVGTFEVPLTLTIKEGSGQAERS